MSESDEDLVIDIDHEQKHEQDIYEPVPSTSSHCEIQILKDLDEGIHSDEELDQVCHDLAGQLSDLSDGSDSEMGDLCAICLGHIRGKIGSPEAPGCEHFFCLLCILEWAKNNPICPQDRRPFERVLVKKHVGGKIISEIVTIKDVAKEEDSVVDTLTFCEVCGSSDREDCLLLCDGCDLGYHLECLTPPLSQVPIEEWFCPLCVAADLPLIVGRGNASQNENNISEGAPIKQKEKIRTQARTRMIPRTRASERVLQRISQTRRKEKKKRKKKYSHNSDTDSENVERRTKEDRGGIVQAFKRPKPFGAINDDDIDSFFNDDAYADKLLSSSSSMDRKMKKMIAYEKLKNHSPDNPTPSYAGRTVHPKVNECSMSSGSTDILTNILENQFVLLSSSKDISLSEERKFTAKDGKRKMEFDVDRENSIMCKPLPSQRKASENGNHSQEGESEDPVEAGFSERETENLVDSHPKKRPDREYSESPPRHRSPRSQHTYKTHGHRLSSSKSNYFGSKDGSSSSRDRYDNDKSYNSWRRDSGRRRRERSRSRSRSRDRDREKDREKRRNKERRKSDYKARCHRSKSNERERRECKLRRYSRTPERHFRDRKPHRSSKSLTSRLFGSSSSQESTDICATDSSQVHSFSLHTVNLPLPNEGDSIKLFDYKTTGMLNSSDSTPVNGAEKEDSNEYESPASSKNECKVQAVSDTTEKLHQKYHSDPDKLKSNKPVHQDTMMHLSVSKSHESDADDRDVVETKKEKLRQLFGDDNSEFESPPSTDTKSPKPEDSLTQSHSHPIKGGNKKKKTNSSKNSLDRKPPQSLYDAVSVSSDSISPSSLLDFQKIAPAPTPPTPETVVEDVIAIKGHNFASPDEFTFPSNFRTLDSEDEQDDITVLSQTGRDLILNSLFGKHDDKNTSRNSVSKGNTSTSKEDSGDSNKRHTAKSESTRKATEKEAVPQNATAKKTDRSQGKDANSTVAKNDTRKDNPKNKSQNKKVEILTSLFGDMSDPEFSDNDSSDKAPKGSCDQILTPSSVVDEAVQSKAISEKHASQQNVDKKVVVEVPKMESQNKKPEKEYIQNRGRSHPEKIVLKEGSHVNGTKDATALSKTKANKVILETKVVEEAKRFLNPHYQDKGFSKEIYKEIISKCVNKVLEVECGSTIEPKKIQKLVEGYVHMYHHRNKKSSTENTSAKP